MKKLYTILIAMLLCGVVQAQLDSLQQIPATVPYTCDFSNQSENARWILTRSGSVYTSYLNHFAIGTGTSVTGGADMSLYISNDTLESYGANNESSRYFAERILDFGNTPQNWVLELDWKASGNQSSTSVSGGLKVFLRDTTDLMPDGEPDYATEYLELALGDTVWRHIRIPVQNVSGLKTLQFYTWGYVNANTRLVPAAIDNISITPATCDAPQFTVTIDGTDAIFNWQGAATDSFQIIYRPVSASPQDTVCETVMGNTGTLIGLLPNTEYIAWMAKLCGTDTSAMYLGTPFTTGCGAYVAPFEEHFSTSQHCWTLDPTFSDSFEYIYTTNYVSYTSSPNNFGYFDTARAISPVIDVSELDYPYLKFSRIQSEYDGARKDLDLYYREYEDDDWHYIGTFITPTGSNTWKTDSVAIPSHSATLQLGFFSIQHGESQLSRISLDDIYVYDGPECEVVSDVALAGQSGDTAYIHYVCNNPSGCSVRYRTANFAAWISTYDLGGYAVITPLSSLTDYEVQVTSVCASEEWISYTFTSQVVAVNLPYSTDFSETADRGWMLDNGTCLNHWTMGVPGGYPQISNALFVTQDDTTAGYGLDNYYTIVVASKMFTMSDISTVNVEFDILCGGSVLSYRSRDFLKVFFAPGTMEYPSSEQDLPYAHDTATTYAVNFQDYLALTGHSSYYYKLNLTQDSILHISVELPNPNPNGEAKLVFVWRNDHITSTDVQPGPVITNVHVWQPTCDVVFDLQVNDIVGNDATVTWTPPAVANSFVVEYKPQSSDWSSAISLTTDTNFLTLNGLSAETDYDVRVRVNCGTALGEGNWRYISFSTACAIVVTDSTPYVEPFSTNPECWNLSVNPNHSWTFYSSNGYVRHQPHYGSPIGDPCPIYSPMMDISAVTHPFLKFLHQQPGDINYHKCDYLQIDYRTSTLSPWHTLTVCTTEASSMRWDSIPLPDTISYIQFAFIALYQEGTNVAIDEVIVYNGPSCAPLTSVSVVDVTGTAAAISWKGGSDNGYLIRYHDISDTAWNYATTLDTMFIINNLQGSTAYVVQVSNDCLEPNWFQAQFSTPLTAVNLPYFTDFSPGSDHSWLLNNGECTNYWTMGEVDTANQVYGLFITENGSTPGYNIGTVSVVTAEKLFEVAGMDSILVEFDVRIGGEGRFDYIKLFIAPFSVEYPASTTADYNNPAYAKYNYTTNAFNFSAYSSYSSSQYSAPYTFAETAGTGFVHIAAKVKSPVAYYGNNQRIKVVFLWKNDNMDGNQPGAIITNVSVKNPTCAPVSQLVVENVLSTTADISWAPGSGGETDWILEYKETSALTWNQVQVSGTPSYSLTGLTPSTDYDLRVKADCGNDQSMPVSTLFTTAICDLSCPYTFVLYDSYGDGWLEQFTPAAFIKVIQNGDTIASLTAIDHQLTNVPTYDTMYVNICHNADISIFWDYGIWWNECGVTVLDPDGNVIYTVTGMWNHDSTLTTFTSNCPFIAPTVITDSADNITQTEAVLHGHIADAGELPILDRGFEWKLLTETDFTAVPVSGDSMSYALANLSPNTTYVYHAFAVTAVETTYGNSIMFTTLAPELPPCPTPSDLHVTDSTGNSLTIAWTENGDAEQWNIQYRTVGGAVSYGTSNVPSYEITGLEPATTYEFQVQSVCDTSTSEWTEVATATTTTGIADYSRHVRVYPNPTQDFINVECTLDNVPGDGISVEVLDVYGKVVRTVVEANNDSPLQTRINVSSLAAGMYFVRVATEAGVVTKAFVKQ